ncbi:MAG: glutathione binding-like protein, partial [Alphaproteobacteria bacterium]
RHGGGRFWSDDAADRSQADRWMDWAQSSLLPEVLGVFWAFYRTPPDKRDQTVINRALAGAARHFGLLDRILANRPFLLGEDLSLADIPAGASLYRWFTLDIQRPDLPHVAAWYERLQARPAYRQHVMVPYDELRGHQDY